MKIINYKATTESSGPGHSMSNFETNQTSLTVSISADSRKNNTKKNKKELITYYKEKLNSIVTFCGIGGSSIGIQKAGLDVILAIDNCKSVEEIYKLNFDKPEKESTFHLHTICDESGKYILQNFPQIKKGEIALMQCSPVCWLFSKANANKVDRNASMETFKSTIKNIDDLQPLTFVIENVDSLFNKNCRLYWLDLKQRLDQLNYEYEACILNAADFKGGNTTRKRAFIIGVRKDLVELGFKPCIPTPNLECKSENSLKKVLGSHYTFYTAGDFDKKKVSADKPCCTLTSHSTNFRLYDDKFKMCKPTVLEIKKVSALDCLFKFPLNNKGEESYTRVIKGCGNMVNPIVMKAVCDELLDNVLLPFFELRENKNNKNKQYETENK